jgi:hypothetical protein
VHDPILLVGDYVRARVLWYLEIEKLIRHPNLPLARLAFVTRDAQGVQSQSLIFAEKFPDLVMESRLPREAGRKFRFVLRKRAALEVTRP